MKRIIRLTERDLTRLVRRVIMEQITIPIKDVRFQNAFDKIGYNGNFYVDRIQNLIYIFNSTTPATVPTKASFPLGKPKDFKLSQGTWIYDPNTKSVSFQ